MKTDDLNFIMKIFAIRDGMADIIETIPIDSDFINAVNAILEHKDDTYIVCDDKMFPVAEMLSAKLEDMGILTHISDEIFDSGLPIVLSGEVNPLINIDNKMIVIGKINPNKSNVIFIEIPDIINEISLGTIMAVICDIIGKMVEVVSAQRF